MSKTLILLRHAKSSWSKPDLADIDRPLKERGHRDAGLIGNWLNDYCESSSIDKLTELVSPANRTRLTINDVNAHLVNINIDEHIDDELYLADDEDMLEIIHGQDDSIESLVLVGHNPGMHILTEYFISRELETFPTCAVACLGFDTGNWRSVVAGNCRSFDFMRPKLLRK